MNGSPLLFEIGTEEIPARFLPKAIDNLQSVAGRLLNEHRIEHDHIHAYATPRRLVLIINSVSPVQKDNIKEVFGPSKKAAFDSKGDPSKAAIGFANSQGINVTDLKIKKKGKGDYVVAVVEEKGEDTKTVLPEILKKVILSLHFPKAMRWGSSSLSFVRPIRWIAALYGTDVVSFELDGIKSGTMTFGHRFLSPAAYQVKDVTSFINLLKNNYVLLDQDKRKEKIRDGLHALFDASDRRPVIDQELLDMVTFIVEYPVPVLCSFHEDYLKLPKELLITVMKDHQKYFAVQDDRDKLTNNFIVVSNTKADNADTVRIGAERVIKARFDDAKFYYYEDIKKTLSDRVEDLKQVTFHDELGTLFDKTDRMISVAAFLSAKTDPSLKEKVMRAAHLAKADLTSGVVREFPELQGIMGKYYADHDREDRETASALEEQYLPHSFGGTPPQTEVGALLSLTDKIDNIISFFSIGLIPTGSEDPFALRRHAMGIISLILERGYTISLEEIFDNALSNHPTVKSKADVYGHIKGFMEQRLEFILSSKGYVQDLIKSVLALSLTNPLRSIIERIEALKKFREEGIFPDFLLAIKRVNNILPETGLPPLNTRLFAQDEEKELHNVFMQTRDEFMPLYNEGKFHESLMVFSRITEPVNTFFDKVLVMDKIEETKLNRLSLLNEIWTSASLVADFSKLL
jgi:glycyl-tRNA synthetase beta chain